MATLPRPRGSHPASFALGDEDITPTGLIRPFLVPREISAVLEKDETGKAILDLVTRQATSSHAASQKIWTAVRGQDKKTDECLAMLKEIREQGKEAAERQEAEAAARKKADEDLAESIGGVLHDLSRNSSADLERDIRVQQVEVVSRTALDTASATKAIVPLSAHGKRQVGLLGVIASFFGALTAFREPILAYLRLRGWIP